MKKIYVDGYLINSNPSNQGGITICKDKECQSYKIKQKGLTNNQVEIIAIIAGMLERRKLISSDSQLAVNLLNGEWKPKNKYLKPLVNLGLIINSIRKKKIIWERRENNLAGIYNDKYFPQVNQLLTKNYVYDKRTIKFSNC